MSLFSFTVLNNCKLFPQNWKLFVFSHLLFVIISFSACGGVYVCVFDMSVLYVYICDRISVSLSCILLSRHKGPGAIVDVPNIF